MLLLYYIYIIYNILLLSYNMHKHIQASCSTTALLIHKKDGWKCKRNTFKEDHSILLVNLISSIKASYQ